MCKSGLETRITIDTMSGRFLSPVSDGIIEVDASGGREFRMDGCFKAFGPILSNRATLSSTELFRMFTRLPIRHA
jgi:hypothetical protein